MLFRARIEVRAIDMKLTPYVHIIVYVLVYSGFEHNGHNQCTYIIVADLIVEQTKSI